MAKADKPLLTPKQEKFCLEYLKTGNASEAYRLSYDTSKMKPEVINKEASVLLGNPKITVWLEALKKPVIKKYEVTYDNHVGRLGFLGELAEKSGQYSAAIMAETQRGKAAGLYENRTRVDGRFEFVWMSNNEDSDPV